MKTVVLTDTQLHVLKGIVGDAASDPEANQTVHEIDALLAVESYPTESGDSLGLPNGTVERHTLTLVLSRPVVAQPWHSPTMDTEIGTFRVNVETLTAPDDVVVDVVTPEGEVVAAGSWRLLPESIPLLLEALRLDLLNMSQAWRSS